MSIWALYTEEQRNNYEEYLKMYSALSAMFNQKSSETGAPYLDSKFQENIYARSFNSENVDIGNTPHDIKSTFSNNDNIGIGIKTWLSSKSSYQKVMQLKAYKNEIDAHIDNNEELAFKIAEIKNSKLKLDYTRLGLNEDENIYHYVTRDKGCLTLSETTYPLVDINNLKPGIKTNSSFTFSDGKKDYKYTFGDSQIWMKFGKDVKNTEELKKLDINILKDPFQFLFNSFNTYQRDGGVLVPESELQRDYLYLPLYSYQGRKVQEHSGLNAWNGKPKTPGSTIPRPKGEAYIPIPQSLWKKYPKWVDSNVDMSNYNHYRQLTGRSSYPIKLHMPDGQVFNALFGQSNFKALETNPQSILGNWILNALGINNPQREHYNEPAKNVVTMDTLKKAGYDSIKLWHKDPSNPKDVWVDFAEYGSFERFMNDDLQENTDDK